MKTCLFWSPLYCIITDQHEFSFPTMYNLTISVETDSLPNYSVDWKWPPSWIQDNGQPITNQNMPPTCFGPGIMTYTLSKAKVCRGWCAHGRQRSSSSISSVPILQFATLQSCYLTTCNLAMFLSCNLQLSKNFCLATYNLAKFLSCNLQPRNIHTLELAT